MVASSRDSRGYLSSTTLHQSRRDGGAIERTRRIPAGDQYTASKGSVPPPRISACPAGPRTTGMVDDIAETQTIVAEGGNRTRVIELMRLDWRPTASPQKPALATRAGSQPPGSTGNVRQVCERAGSWVSALRCSCKPHEAAPRRVSGLGLIHVWISRNAESLLRPPYSGWKFGCAASTNANAVRLRPIRYRRKVMKHPSERAGEPRRAPWI